MARPNYNLRESLYPALGALGTYTSNLAQYSGQMTPYKRDPRLDQQRAFGDALMAYMRALPQREQMFQQREQLRIDRERQRRADERQRKLDQRQDELFPLQKELQQIQINTARRNDLSSELEYKQKLRRKSLFDNYSKYVTDNIPEGELRDRFLKMDPSAGIPRIEKYIDASFTRPAKPSEVVERFKGLAPLITVNDLTGEKKYPPDFGKLVEEYNKDQQVGYRPATDAERKEAGVTNPRVLMQVHPDGKTNPKYPPRYYNQGEESKKFTSEKMQGYLARGRSDVAFRSTPEYEQAYVKEYVGEKPVERVAKNGERYIDYVDKPLPDPSIQPYPTNLANVLAEKAKQPIVSRERTLPQPFITQNAFIAQSARSLKVQLTELRNHLNTYGVKKFGTEAGVQSNLRQNIFGGLQVIKNLGVPTGRDVELVANEILNPTELSLQNWIKAGGDERSYTLAQIDELEKNANMYLADADSIIYEGTGLSYEELQKARKLDPKKKLDATGFENAVDGAGE